jgi:hypothetical protein
MSLFPQGALHAVPHPQSFGGAIIVVGTDSGTVAAFESIGLKEARLIGRTNSPGAVVSVCVTKGDLQVSLFSL